MAKSNKDERGGKIKVSIVQFELEGSDDTLQEGLRTISETLGRSFPQAQRVIAKIPAAPSRLALPGGDPVHEGQILDQEEEIEADEAPTIASKARTKSARQYPSPEYLDDIDLTREVSFRDFCEGKDVSSDLKKYLVLAAWYKEHREIDEIGANHAYTCYKFMNWKVPKDMGQTFRSGKAQKAWFKGGTEKGAFMLTHTGLDVVNQMGSTA